MYNLCLRTIPLKNTCSRATFGLARSHSPIMFSPSSSICVPSFVKYSLEQAQTYLKERPGINEADIDTQVYCTTVSWKTAVGSLTSWSVE